MLCNTPRHLNCSVSWATLWLFIAASSKWVHLSYSIGIIYNTTTLVGHNEPKGLRCLNIYISTVRSENFMGIECRKLGRWEKFCRTESSCIIFHIPLA